MWKKLFIGNIEWAVTEEDLTELFSQYGEVEEAIIIKDRFSGRSKGFGFVTFTEEEGAEAAMGALDNYELNERPLAVKEAKPQAPRD